WERPVFPNPRLEGKERQERRSPAHTRGGAEMLHLAILIVVIGAVGYSLSAALMSYYLERRMPGLLDTDASLPPPAPGQKYLWEKTAGTGIVPKWVSLVNLLSILAFFSGVAVLVYFAI